MAQKQAVIDGTIKYTCRNKKKPPCFHLFSVNKGKPLLEPLMPPPWQPLIAWLQSAVEPRVIVDCPVHVEPLEILSFLVAFRRHILLSPSRPVSSSIRSPFPISERLFIPDLPRHVPFL